ncbi:MAG: bifunctional folylpolyglutamate synthase/dihydrofolate synthase [Gammaproteobacteria bacterium]|nr:bifunctional folylpolyglutamate synthase/dihydrofolate synthase [Gammaproteobacteria bacterium]
MHKSLNEWLDFIEAVHPEDIELGLERVREVANAMGLLPPASRTVIVAGTNGKGSTAVFTEQLLRVGGLRVGTTLSPHVHEFNERVRLDGVSCADEMLCESFEKVEDARHGVPLTYFEFASLVALDVFRTAAVDVAILEVGLGGRLDAFNVVDADVAAITSIGLDHQDYLGDNLEVIGSEKAGVLRPGQRVVLGETVTTSVIERAGVLGCETSRLSVELELEMTASDWSLTTPWEEFPNLPWGNLAPHNCALAIEIAHYFVNVTPQMVQTALKGAMLPGRFEAFANDERQWLVDVAHNPAGAAFLAELIKIRYPGKRLVAIFGMFRDKDSTGVAALLAPLVSHWICLSTTGARGLSADDLRLSIPADLPCSTVADVAAAVRLAGSLTSPEDVILGFGSFAVASAVRELLWDHTYFAERSL